MSNIRSIDGLPVIDAKRALQIVVQPGDISRSLRANGRKEPDSCAMAKAMRRQTHCKDVRIHLARTYVRQNDGNWQRYMTPGALRQEIIAFDRGGRFEPGAYLLKVAQPSKKATGKRQGSDKDKRKNKKRRHSPTVVKNVRTGPANYV